MSGAVLPPSAAVGARVAGTGLWVFIGVASVLFTLFVVAYVMRISAADASPIALPWQLWSSTALLAAGSALMHAGARAAAEAQRRRAQIHLWAGGAAAVAFLASQLWAWQSLLDARVGLASNPAASFFYLLTALHGLHVLGGLVAWSVAAAALAGAVGEVRAAGWRIALCARYWHFLLVVWVAVFTLLSVVTPEVARRVCGIA